MRRPGFIPVMDRLRYIGYGAIGGLVIGIIVGWILHAWVGFAVKMLFVIFFVGLFLLALNFWRKVTTKPPEVNETRVPDGEWIEIESGTRRRQE